jgi:hypothetical protein
MLKTKRRKFALIAITIFSLVTMYGYIPSAIAASMESAKDTVSDSDLGVTATHTIIFDLTDANPLTAGEFISVDFGSFTGDVEGNVNCPTDTSASTTPDSEVGCVVDAGGFLESTTTQQMSVTGVTNPGSAGDYTVIITSYNASYTEIEHTDMKVYIIDDVTVTARVDARLTFTIYGLATSTDVNGETITGSSTPTALSFGTLDDTSSSSLGQELKVSTNATGGFTVTVQQSGELENSAGAKINSFRDSQDGTGTTTPEAWASPSGTLDYTNEYGHMGLTSEDGTLSGGNPFGDALFAGLAGTSATEVMYHNGPSDGTGDGVGVTQVAYKIEITSLQEAGDYENTLTYICTPTF